jgi:uncharacterized protein with FMN-binding domain
MPGAAATFALRATTDAQEASTTDGRAERLRDRNHLRGRLYADAVSRCRPGRRQQRHRDAGGQHPGVTNCERRADAGRRRHGTHRPAPTAAAPTATAPTTAAPTVSATSGYKDGTYPGQGTSRRRGLSVSVTVQSGTITNVQITSVNTEYPVSRIASLPAAVLKQQTANVNVISGATYSSQAFKQAVQQAVALAQTSSGPVAG